MGFNSGFKGLILVFSLLLLLLLLLLSLLLLLFKIYYRLLVTRWQSSVKSRSQQQIKAIYPSTSRKLCAVLISVSSVALWLTGDLGATEGSDLMPP